MLAFLPLLASAAFGIGYYARLALASSAHLTGRQLPTGAFNPNSIPPQCDNSCSEILNTIQTCTQLSCLCTDSVAGTIASCVDCLVAVGGEQETGQEIIDQYTSACETSDSSVTSIIVSSIAPSASPLSSSASQNTSSTSSSLSSAPSQRSSSASFSASSPQTTSSAVQLRVMGFSTIIALLPSSLLIFILAHGVNI